ncbi:hypothetical protein [Alteromonas sp.]|jgi:hypothetical protein|uniref:hypothetical protein n=1 Tax=Alteromonas sp. TaxID=232 RepID=UPI0032D99B3D
MGTEILVLTYLTTPLIFLANVVLLFKSKFPNSKALVLLLLNVVFMGYFVVSGLLSEYFIQAYLVGGFLLIPFQILALIAATLVGSKVRKLIGSNSDPEFK